MVFSRKKAESPSGTGAPFLIVLTILIVFYVIFLPPAEREALLNDGTVPGTGGTGSPGGTGGTGTTSGSGKTIYEQTFKGPGPMDRLTRLEYSHEISAFTLSGEYEATVIAEANQFRVERSVFTSTPYTMDFTADPMNLKDVILTFTVLQPQQASGSLLILLNGKQAFSGTISQFNSGQIKVPSSYLDDVNTLSVSVSSPGLAFWHKNAYEIADLRLQADAIDRQGLASIDSFDVSDVELDNLRSAKLRFLPTCSGDVDPLTVVLNNRTIFSKVPDCGLINIVSIPSDLLEAHDNNVSFRTTGGAYSIDRAAVQTTLDEDRGATFFFELDEDWFVFSVEQDAICGEIDGACPVGCAADVDKDCCFVEYDTPYWCELPTQYQSDRCVGFVDTNTAGRCLSGYEDEDGDIHEDFEETCGDNNDDLCPAGCSIYHDKDCCFAGPIDSYWCEDLPVGGVANICKNELSVDEYGFCPSGYESEEDGRLSSTYRRSSTEERLADLDDKYRVTAEFIFVDDDEDHAAELVVNGYKTNIDTNDDRYVRDISEFVVDHSNYIQVIPKTDFSLVTVRVKVERR
ncbi:MAG TPA: hypothetical protein VK158_04860 [Acidobacteriota bacterium]|nr:hypothetical protein [Acidobacteriota bacterium]